MTTDVLIKVENLRKYFKGDMIKAGEFDKICEMTKEAVAKVKE